MVSTAASHNRKYVLDGITSKVNFKISSTPTRLLYATDIKQTTLYIQVYSKSYINSCLLKLGWVSEGNDSSLMVPLPPSTIKEMANSCAPLEPDALLLIVDKFGFQY
jgi:hypothetical protein